MVAAVDQPDLHVRHREARQNAALERLHHAGFDRLDVLLGYRAAKDFVDELEAGACRERLHADLRHAVLAMTAGLLDVPPFGFRRPADSLAIGNLRLAYIGANAELAHH